MEAAAGHWHRRVAAIGGRLQVAALRAVIGGLRRFGPVSSSNLGGCIMRSLGPILPSSRVADRNLSEALPLLDAEGRRRTIRGVWDNLGRTAAELPHLAGFARTTHGPGWEIEGEQHLEQIRQCGAQALFFSGHLGNWEMVLPIAAQLGLPVSGFYRAASNAGINSVIQAMRQDALGDGVTMFPKGARGARAALAHLRRGGSLGLLVDQKMNDGIAVPFFGRDAMTAPALAQFALRFDAPILPVHVLRIGPARFRMVCDPPLVIPRSGDHANDVLAISCAMNLVLEGWIREQPHSWLWLHRRWPKPVPLQDALVIAIDRGAVSRP